MSSSLRYTFTKLRTFPSSVNSCLRRSGYCDVRAVSASPTVWPVTLTESCLPVYCRSGVGIRILGMSVNQLLFGRLGLVIVGQPAIGVVELSVADREHHEGIPWTRILEVRAREVGVAIGMRMVNADEVH